jgi:lysophospholipase L1-like esterase
VSDAPEINVTLYSDIHHEYVQILQGDFIQEEILIEPGEEKTITLKPAESVRALPSQAGTESAFAPHVYRLKLSGTGRIHFVSVDAGGGEVRPPQSYEKPALRWLAYGSSITHGFSAPRLSMPYIYCASRLLGIDVYNLGFGGSCHVENALADYFAARDDWDIITLELGVNLIDNPMTEEEFTARVRYMVQTLVEAHPQKPIVLITIYPISNDMQDEANPQRQRTAALRQVLRDIHAETNHPHLHLIEGSDILTNFTGLTTDLCHPSEFGHAIMGANLAPKLASFLGVGTR